ncbi:hypothetical protein C2E23DRAFT_690227, partial [Lenzites betulinus]
MWLKAYLDISETRPKWALIADSLIAKAILAPMRRVSDTARINTFLQSWGVNTAVSSGLPRDLARMIKVARKYGVRLDSQSPGTDLLETLPVWYHFALVEQRSTANSKSGTCLRENHEVHTVGDCLSVLRKPTAADQHRERKDCPCMQCTHDRESLGCDNPARCAKAAAAILSKLKEKWRPRPQEISDGLSLTKVQRDANRVAAKDGETVTFDPSVTQHAPIGSAFRVFARSGDVEGLRARRQNRPFQIPEEAVDAYTDGSCLKNGYESAQAGAGVWFGQDDPRNTAARVPGLSQTNQAGEAYACLLAANSTPDFVPLTIITD